MRSPIVVPTATPTTPVAAAPAGSVSAGLAMGACEWQREEHAHAGTCHDRWHADAPWTHGAHTSASADQRSSGPHVVDADDCTFAQSETLQVTVHALPASAGTHSGLRSAARQCDSALYPAWTAGHSRLTPAQRHNPRSRTTTGTNRLLLVDTARAWHLTPAHTHPHRIQRRRHSGSCVQAPRIREDDIAAETTTPPRQCHH